MDAGLEDGGEHGRLPFPDDDPDDDPDDPGRHRR
jgi:hypothetical protein